MEVCGLAAEGAFVVRESTRTRGKQKLIHRAHTALPALTSGAEGGQLKVQAWSMRCADHTYWLEQFEQYIGCTCQDYITTLPYLLLSM
jgi:hypothetical protein